MDSIIKRKIRKLFNHPIDFIRDLKILRKYTWKKAPIPVQAKSENAKNINRETKKDKVPLQPKVVVPQKPATQDDFFREMQIGVNLIHKFSLNYPVNSLRWKGKILLWPAIRFYLTLVSVIYSRGGLKNGRVSSLFPIYIGGVYILKIIKHMMLKIIYQKKNMIFWCFQAIKVFLGLKRTGKFMTDY